MLTASKVCFVLEYYSGSDHRSLALDVQGIDLYEYGLGQVL